MALLTTHPQARELPTGYYDVFTDTIIRTTNSIPDTSRQHYTEFWSPIRIGGAGGAGIITDDDDYLTYTSGETSSNDLSAESTPAANREGSPLVVLAPTAYPAEFMGLPAPAPIPQRSYAIILEELAYLAQHLGIDATRPVDEQMMALREWIESRHANIFS